VCGRQRLHPCWVIVPHHTGEMPHPEKLAPALLGSGARMARIFCGEKYYSERLDPFAYGALLEMLEHHRIPLMVEFEVKDNGGGALDTLNTKDLRSVLDSFPQLRLILACPKSTGMNRVLFPMMERYEHLALETSGYQLFGGLEVMTTRFGAKRLLYGSRAPYFDPAPGMIALQYAELEETQKQLIAGENLRKLFSEVLV
jgi:predicted TIM-barrel fold metal-dependent hydrolase